MISLDINQTIIGIGSFVFLSLLSLNIFFIKGVLKRVEKIDALENRISIFESRLSVLIERALVERAREDVQSDRGRRTNRELKR